MTTQFVLNPLSRGRDGEATYDCQAAGEQLLQYAGKVHVAGEFACMATWLGDGYFLTTRDTVRQKAGSYPYDAITVEMQWGGPECRRLEIDWAVELPHKPLLLMKCTWRPPSALGPIGAISVAPLFDILESKNRDRFWRIGYTGGVFGEDVDPNRLPYVTPGYHVYDMAHQWYRGALDEIPDAKSTICVHCCFDYPHRKDYGSPVVLQDGRLAAILVSGDLGSEAHHQGAVIPLELVLPTARLWAHRSAERDFHSKHGMRLFKVGQF